jgi:hypothetical protein
MEQRRAVCARFHASVVLGVGAEYDGIGSDFQIWTVKAKGAVPFSAQ